MFREWQNDQQQQDNREEHQWPRPLAPSLRIDFREYRERNYTGSNPDQVPQNEIAAAETLVLSVDRTRAVDRCET